MVNDKRPNNKYHDNGNTNNIDNDHCTLLNMMITATASKKYVEIT